MLLATLQARSLPPHSLPCWWQGAWRPCFRCVQHTAARQLHAALQSQLSTSCWRPTAGRLLSSRRLQQLAAWRPQCSCWRGPRCRCQPRLLPLAACTASSRQHLLLMPLLAQLAGTRLQGTMLMMMHGHNNSSHAAWVPRQACQQPVAAAGPSQPWQHLIAKAYWQVL